MGSSSGAGAGSSRFGQLAGQLAALVVAGSAFQSAPAWALPCDGFIAKLGGKWRNADPTAGGAAITRIQVDARERVAEVFSQCSPNQAKAQNEARARKARLEGRAPEEPAADCSWGRALLRCELEHERATLRVGATAGSPAGEIELTLPSDARLHLRRPATTVFRGEKRVTYREEMLDQVREERSAGALRPTDPLFE